MTLKQIKDAIAANEHLLALYDSPFPDAQERAKRQELRNEIARLKSLL